jgi:hypothetical protein
VIRIYFCGTTVVVGYVATVRVTSQQNKESRYMVKEEEEDRRYTIMALLEEG